MNEGLDVVGAAFGFCLHVLCYSQPTSFNHIPAQWEHLSAISESGLTLFIACLVNEKLFLQTAESCSCVWWCMDVHIEMLIRVSETTVPLT